MLPQLRVVVPVAFWEGASAGLKSGVQSSKWSGQMGVGRCHPSQLEVAGVDTAFARDSGDGSPPLGSRCKAPVQGL